jgi:hypothetical protein
VQPSWQNIQGFSGAAAVGALTLIGFILIANAFATNLLPAIDFYSRTPTWAIVIGIPTLALTYLLGLLSIGTAEVLLLRLGLVDPDAFIEDHIAVSGRGDFVAGHFQQLRQEAQLLAGGAVGLALMAVGAVLSAWATEGWRRFLVSIAVAAIVLALASISLARFRNAAAHHLAVAATARTELPACEN